MKKMFRSRLWSKIITGSIKTKLMALLGVVLFLVLAGTMIGMFVFKLKTCDALWWSWTHVLDPGFLGDDKDDRSRQLWGSVFSTMGLVLIGGAFITLAEEAAKRTVENLMNGRVPKNICDHTVIVGKHPNKIKSYIDALNNLTNRPSAEKIFVTVQDQESLMQVRTTCEHNATSIVGQLESLNFQNARRVILLENSCGSAGETLKQINLIYEKINSRSTPEKALEVYAEVNNRDLAKTLRMVINRLDTNCNSINLHILNVADASARLALKKYPLDCLPILPGGTSRVTLVIEGWTKFSQALFWQALRTAHYLVKPTRIIVSHPKAASIENEIFAASPGLCDAWVRSDLVNVSFVTQLTSQDCSINEDDIVTCAICDENQDKSFALALQRQERPFPGLEQIYLELPEGSGYSDIVQKINKNNNTPQGVTLVSVGPTDEAIDFEEKLDELAEKIHAHYQRKYNDVPWEQLDETKRGWNRSPADHIDVKVRMLATVLQMQHPGETEEEKGRRLKTLIENLAGYPENGNEQLGEYVNLLSRMEHDRWSAEKYADGWVYADKRDNATKKHHLLVPYDKLSEPEQLKDWETMKIVLGYEFKKIIDKEVAEI